VRICCTRDTRRTSGLQRRASFTSEISRTSRLVSTGLHRLFRPGTKQTVVGPQAFAARAQGSNQDGVLKGAHHLRDHGTAKQHVGLDAQLYRGSASTQGTTHAFAGGKALSSWAWRVGTAKRCTRGSTFKGASRRDFAERRSRSPDGTSRPLATDELRRGGIAGYTELEWCRPVSRLQTEPAPPRTGTVGNQSHEGRGACSARSRRRGHGRSTRSFRAIKRGSPGTSDARALGEFRG